MAKEISYKNDNEPLKNETCEMSHFPENYDEAVTIINNATGLSHSDLISEIKLYNTKLTSLKNTRSIITGSKYAKDNLLFSVIKNTNAPKYLKHEIFNYKALVLYFMRSFKNSKKILIKDLDNSKMSEMSLRDLNRKYFQNNDFININTHLDTLLHLINIDKQVVKTKKILEQMIYNTVEYGNHVSNKDLFKAKVSSIPWVMETLENPDLIYGEESIIAKELKFTLAFVRETGSGTSGEKYMYHLVGLKRLKANFYTLISQFPIEKDKKYSTSDVKISQLHNYIQCAKPLYIKSGLSIPKYSSHINTNDSAEINRLKKHLGK